MLNPDDLYELDEHILQNFEVKNLPLIVGFLGFSEAGSVVSQIAGEIFSTMSHKILAVFDIDQLFDYRNRRPNLLFAKNKLQEYSQPELKLYLVKDTRGNDFLFLHGVEPDYQWERLIASIVNLVNLLNVKITVWAHAIALPIPHTRPIGVTSHGNRTDLVLIANSWSSVAQISASVAHLLEVRFVEMGLPIVGYVVHVPQYIAESRFPSAVLAVLEYFSTATGVVFDLKALKLNASFFLKQLEEQMLVSGDMGEVVKMLEEKYDAFVNQGDSGRFPNGDQLAADFEKYLIDHNKKDEEGKG